MISQISNNILGFSRIAGLFWAMPKKTTQIGLRLTDEDVHLFKQVKAILYPDIEVPRAVLILSLARKAAKAVVGERSEQKAETKKTRRQ
jgi:hypothetical protein